MSIIVLLSPTRFFHFFLDRIIIYKSKTIIFLFQREIIITSLKKKVSTNTFEIDIKGIPDRLEICRNIMSE